MEEQQKFREVPPSPKSTQNEIVKQPAYRSLDSGIVCGVLDNTNATTGSDNGSFSSTPFSNSFNAHKTESSELISDRKNKKYEKRSIIDESVQYSKSLPHVNKISFTDLPLNELKLRKPTKKEEIIEPVLEANKELAEQEELVEEIVENVGALIVEDEDEVKAKIEQPKRKFSLIRFLGYGLLFAIMFSLFLVILLPILMPSCCDYRKEFLIFNEKFINDDDILPPV
jgi:hypothetical protein